MNITQDTIVGELVAHDYRTATVFSSLGIDFCCNGNRSITEACKSKNIEPQVALEKLKALTAEPENNNINFDQWPLDLLADYIEKKHHRYTENRIQEIKPYLEKIVRVHGARHPELAEIEQLFLRSSGELAVHMKKEELILFPMIRKMVLSANAAETSVLPPIANPVAVMKNEHNTEGEYLSRMSELSNHYTPPADACNTYKTAFAMLKELEDDLHLHIHLENNILFPKAIELQKK